MEFRRLLSTGWRPRWDLNPRPPAWQAGVLTNWTTWPYFFFFYIYYIIFFYIFQVNWPLFMFKSLQSSLLRITEGRSVLHFCFSSNNHYPAKEAGWYRKWDSDPHVFWHPLLRRTRLPISPFRHIKEFRAYRYTNSAPTLVLTQVLNSLWYSRWDSDPHFIGSKPIPSTDWGTRAYGGLKVNQLHIRLRLFDKLQLK